MPRPTTTLAARAGVPVWLALALLAGSAPDPALGTAPADCSSTGCEAWAATYQGPGVGLDTPRSAWGGYAVRTVATSPDGSRVYVTGASWGGDPAQGGTQYDYATVAYDGQTGAELWVSRYEGTLPSDSAWPQAVAVDPSGARVIVTGSVANLDPVDWDYATVAYDAETGQELWVDRFDGSRVDRAWSLGVDPHGSLVYVTGDSRPAGAVTADYLTIAHDAATGARRWTARYEGLAAGRDEPRWLAISPDGSALFVTGRSEGTGTGMDYATAAYDAETGAERWVTRYTGGGAAGWDEATSVAAGPGGAGVFVTGQSGAANGAADYATVAYDAATGTQRWATRYDGPGGSIDVALSVEVARDGTAAYVTGQSVGSGTGYDYATAAYDAETGTERWVARYNGPPGNSSDDAYAVAVSPDDSTVFVTGESADVDFNSWDIQTMAYDAATGLKRGGARFDGVESFQDAAFAVAVAPDGDRVYVNGETWHSTTPGVGDFATLAYDTLTLNETRPVELSAELSGEQVIVRGRAAFGGQDPLPVGQDAGGDNLGGATAAPLGIDLRRASISQPDPEQPRLLFTLQLAGLQGGGIPEGIAYGWDVSVDGGPQSGGARWSIRTMRTRAAATAGADPYAAVFSCPGEEASCVESSRLSAVYDVTNKEVRVAVPLAAIGADPGSTIEPWPRTGPPVWIGPTASGAGTQPGLIDAMDHQPYRVPEKTVLLALAPAGTPPGAISFDATASLEGDGAFEGSLPIGDLSGPADVWAKVCYGPLCTAASIRAALS